MTTSTLLIAARAGAVTVDAGGPPIELTSGNAVKLFAEGGSGTPSSQTASSGGIRWGAITLCALGGAALGSIPVIVNQQSVSPDPDWRWGLIPVGAVGGGLICREFLPVPGKCTLAADQTTIVEGDPVTLRWTSPHGYKDTLSGVGDEPPSGDATVTPDGTGPHRYKLTAQGAGGTLVCMADVVVVARKEPDCTITATPAKLDKPGDETKITWTLPKNATEANLTRPVPAKDLLTEKQPLTFKPKERTMFLVVGKTPGGSVFTCQTVVEVTTVNCTLRATAKADGKTVTLSWTTENATGATLQGFIGDTPVGDPYDVPAGDLASGKLDVEPERSVRYVLTVKGPPRPDKLCPQDVPVPECSIWGTRITQGRNKDKFQLQWTYKGFVNKLELDPAPTPAPNLRPYTSGSGSGSAVVDPSTATDYTLTVTGGLGGKLVRTCEASLKPTRCKLDAPPEVDAKSKTFPLTWTAENATGATLEVVQSGKPVGKPAPVDVSAGTGTIDQPTPKESTEYVLNVTGPGGAKSQCRACVTIRQGTGKTLPIQPETQKTGMWCWLTVGQMVFTYYKVPNLSPIGIYQCGIIGIVLPNLCGVNCALCAGLGGGSGMREFITDMLKKYPEAAKMPAINSDYVIRKDLKTCPLTAQQIKDQIDKGQPVIAGISTSGQHKYPPEHVALIVGYEEVDGKLRLRVNDPYPFPANNDPYLKAGAQKNCGGSYYVDYETFCEKMAWDSAWYNIKPAGK